MNLIEALLYSDYAENTQGDKVVVSVTKDSDGKQWYWVYFPFYTARARTIDVLYRKMHKAYGAEDWRINWRGITRDDFITILRKHPVH